jgi:tetratricopeptide (TPR) repeat protein
MLMGNAFIFVVIIVALFLAGCISNPINAKTAQNYYEWGVEAERGGDLELARRDYSRSYTNTVIGNLGPNAEAHALYEWSRVTGYLGMYADAEKGFNDVLALIDKSQGKADNLRPPALLELARLFHDTNQHAKATPVYEKAIAELDKLGIEKIDPIGFSVVLDDYSESLKAVGKSMLSEEVASRSRSIKEANKGREAKFMGRRYKTP